MSTAWLIKIVKWISWVFLALHVLALVIGAWRGDVPLAIGAAAGCMFNGWVLRSIDRKLIS